MSLVEVMIALTILATVLIALGGLMYQVARHTRQSAAVGYRSAAAATAAGWAQALPWDSLAGAAGCVAQSVGQFLYSQCTTVTDVSPGLKQITVVISPTGNLVAAPETVMVARHKIAPPSPFNVN
jgi:Tfp pilus assembly protein PilV